MGDWSAIRRFSRDSIFRTSENHGDSYSQDAKAALLEMAGPEQKEDNQDEQTYAAEGIKTPLLAVPPNRKNSHKRDDQKYRKNKCQHSLASLFLPSEFETN